MPSEMYTGINTGRPQLQFALPYNQPSVQYNLSTLSYSQYSLQYDQLPAPCNQPPVQHRPCVQYDQPPVQHQLSVQYNQPPVQHQPSVKYNQESAEYIQPTIQYQQPSVQYTQSSDLSNNPIASHVSLNSHPSNAPPLFTLQSANSLAPSVLTKKQQLQQGPFRPGHPSPYRRRPR